MNSESLQIQISAFLSTGANVVLLKVPTPTEKDVYMDGVETELETGDDGDAVGSYFLLLEHPQSRRHMKVVVLVEYSMGGVLGIHSPG